MPSKVQLTGGKFQDAEGNILVNGYLLMKLNQDGVVSGVGEICSGIEIKILLNSSGSVDTSTPQYVWGDDNISPVNTFYRVTAYSAQGQPVWGPNSQQVVGGPTFDVGTWVPNQVISWTPPLTPVLLESNGVPNASQQILNLESTDASVTITDLGSGNVNLQASGGGGGVSGKWPGNWIGFNSAAVSGENVETGSIGAFFSFLASSASGAPLVAPTATQPKAVNQNAQSSGLTNAFGLVDNNLDLTAGILKDWFVKVAMVGGTAARYWSGVTDMAASSIPTGFHTNTPAANFIGFRYSAGTDTNIVAVCQTDATHQTVVDTGVAPSLSTTPQVLEIVPTASGATITFYINGVLKATISTNVPTNSTPMGSLVVFDGQGSGGTNAGINLFYLYALLSS